MDDFKAKLYDEFLSILEEEGVARTNVEMSTKLKELDLSSMQFLRVVGALEDLVGVPLDASLGKVESVDDLIQELVKLKEAL